MYRSGCEYAPPAVLGSQLLNERSRSYSREVPQMAPDPAAGGHFHAESLDVEGRSSLHESLHVSSALLAQGSGNQNLCHWEPGSSEPDSVRVWGAAPCACPALTFRIIPSRRLAQPLQPLSAAVEAGGQSSVGPANYHVSEAAALRLGCRDCQRAILTNERCSMPSGLLHRLSAHQIWPLRPRLQQSSSERAAPI